MSGFTPGPWVYEEFIGKYKNELGEIVTTKKKYSKIRIDNEEIFIVGDSCVWSPKTSEEVSNMKLIAAAPDLYAALSLFMEYNELMDGGDDVAGMLKYAELMEAAPKALAKARGES